ncbi:MAG: DUF3014 domain-containing protein [Rhizobacter sp.]|nr:DUF3014 domain-containing protein [Rhizobacter sp.]
MNTKTIWWVLLLALVGLAAAGLYWWQRQVQAPSPVVSAPIAIAPPPVAAPPVASAPPAIAHPIEAAASAPEVTARTLPAPDQAGSYVNDALLELLGRKSVLTFMNTEGFVAHLVATVDNLDRAHAAARLWPLNPTPQRFVTISSGTGTLIGAENAKRYEPMVGFVESVNSAKAVALYRHLYPLFQHAYEQLGYPGKYFNDRLVQVIDHLLQTPEPAEPITVQLTEVKGPIESTTPWLRYEYADPALESRSAGQKILMRVGKDNAKRLKAKLAEIRRLVARG